MKKFGWGIIATGNIAGSMAEALQGVDEAELVAVASRSQASADRFGEKWAIPRRYDSYEALALDEAVDIVYIATPHHLHYQNMLSCLQAGKHVLCEKPLTLNAREAAECIALAREKNLFLMEAVWMRFFPAMAQIRRWVADGVIGDVRLIKADFCINVPFDPAHRLYNPELGGGALLDLGIYPLSFTTMLMGYPQGVMGQAQIGATGIDELNALTLTYDNDVVAQLASSVRVHKPMEAFVVGSNGYIKVHDIFFRPDVVTLHVNGRSPETTSIPFKGNGYAHEIEEVHACLQAGQTESQIMPLVESYRLLQLMDDLRESWGVRYAADG